MVCSALMQNFEAASEAQLLGDFSFRRSQKNTQDAKSYGIDQKGQASEALASPEDYSTGFLRQASLLHASSLS